MYIECILTRPILLYVISYLFIADDHDSIVFFKHCPLTIKKSLYCVGIVNKKSVTNMLCFAFLIHQNYKSHYSINDTKFPQKYCIHLYVSKQKVYPGYDKHPWLES